MKKWALAAVAAVSIAMPSLVTAQDFPSRPVTIVVPFPAGSGTDVVARLVAAELQPRLGQPVVVENQPGASGIVGSQTVAGADPDGHTIMLTSSSHAILPSIQDSLPFDVIDDFAPISMVSAGPVILTANKDLKANDLAELKALLEAEPDLITFASTGGGTIPAMAFELLKMRTGMQMPHVNYSGGSTAIVDVITGVTQLSFTAPSTAMPYLESGDIKALGLSSVDRPQFIVDSPIFADIPTLDAQGLEGFNVELWYGLLAPGGTPDEVVAKLQKEVAAVLESETIAKRFDELGVGARPTTSQEFADYLDAEVAQWAEVAAEMKAAGN
jgi:tripartite-type tricarboxylate transporter receptor subunit TctC